MRKYEVLGLRSKPSGPCVTGRKAVSSAVGRVHSQWQQGSAKAVLSPVLFVIFNAWQRSVACPVCDLGAALLQLNHDIV